MKVSQDFQTKVWVNLTDALLPAPVSLTSPNLPFVLKKSATNAKASAILSVVHSELSPELSESRYLCKSKIKFVVLPSKFVIPIKATPEPLLTNCPAEAKFVPGRRIIWLVAPAVRIAVTAAWQLVAQVAISRS